MANFNFLSGSSIDNLTKNLFDFVSSGKCYLGMARGECRDLQDYIPNIQWGVNALVYVEFPEGVDFKTLVAASGDGDRNPNKYYDINSIRSNETSAAGQNTSINIYKVPNDAVSGTDSPLFEPLVCNYIGSNWMLIEKLPRNYYDTLKLTPGYKFVITNHAKNFDIAAKILPKSFVSVPFYSVECRLYSKGLSADIATGLQKVSNIIGESYVVGLHDPAESATHPYLKNPSLSGTANKAFLKNDTFQLKDTGGTVLIDNMTMIDPDGSQQQIYFNVATPDGDLGNTSRHMAFQYNYVAGEAQTIKVIVGNRQVDELAIWNEKQPYDSVIPVCDASPPGLEVSFLKNPLLVNSIFDVKGMFNIPSSAVTFIKEMGSIAERDLYAAPVSAGGFGYSASGDMEEIELNGAGYVHSGVAASSIPAGQFTIPMKDYHTFVKGDVVTLKQIYGTYTVDVVVTTPGSASITLTSPVPEPVTMATEIYSKPTSAVARITLAKTTDKKKALRHGFTSAMIHINVPLSGDDCPTLDVYRQLFISYESKDASGNMMTGATKVYKSIPYNSDSIFNKTTKEWDLGTILYISNKVPIYRQHAKSTTGFEEFKIIL